MKRFLVLAAAAMPLTFAAPAAADYHGACPGGVGSGAGVSLTASAGTFTYSGTVGCNGASSISINSLTLTRPDSSTASAGPTSCTACNSLSHSGQDPAGPAGNYVVTMNFTAQGGTSGPITKTRTGTWTWDGSTLTLVGGGGGTPSPFEFCDGTQPVELDSEFHNDNDNPTDPLRMGISGRLECHGADALAITQFTVRRQAVSGSTLIGPVRTGTQNGTCGAGCSVVSGSGSFPSDGPGRYRLAFRIAVTKNGSTRSHTTIQDYVSLGAGPVFPVD